MRRHSKVFFYLLLFLITQSPQINPTLLIENAPTSDLFFTSTGSSEAVIDGKSYYVLVGDLHMHTNFSDGSQSPIQMILAARELGYDFIAITDHNTISGVLKGREEAQKNGINIIIIIGEEVTTDWGHLLALNINNVVSPNLEPNETCDMIHYQGGYAVPAHPVGDWDPNMFKSLIENHFVDAYEAYNGYTNYTSSALEAASETAQYPYIGDSDAHSLQALGTSRTIVFSVDRTINGIFNAILNHRVVVDYNNTYVGNTTFVSVLENLSKTLDAKAAIGSAEAGIFIAKEKEYQVPPDIEKAETVLQDSINYYWNKEYDKAIASAQQVKDIIANSVPLTRLPVMEIAGVIIGISVIAVLIYYLTKKPKIE